MADVRITALPAAQSPISGSELVPIVQNGLTVQTTVSAITQSPSLTQTFLTVGLQSGLPNSRYFSTGVGIGITDGGAQGAYSIALNGTSASLEGATTGFPAKTAPNTIVSRTLTTSGNGVAVTNGDGVAGNPVFQLTGLAAAIANASGTGILGLNGSLLTPLTITGTTNQIGVLNGNGSGGNPTISISNNAIFPGTAGVTLPNGTTAQRGANQGEIRYNTDTSRFEGLYGSGWQPFGIGDGTLTSVSGTTNQINVSNAGGIATVSISSDPVVPGVASVQIPSGTTAQRPVTGVNGQLRYNTTTGTFEGYANGIWGAIVSGLGVSSVATGTGLTGGPITSTGTISIANTGVVAGTYGNSARTVTQVVNAQGQLTSIFDQPIAISASQVTSGTFTVSQGGTGVSTLTGLAFGNGTSAFTAATSAQVVSAIGTTAVTNATNATNIIGGLNGSIPYQTGASATSFIAAGTNGYLLTMNAGLPSWQPAPASGVTTFQTSLSGLTPNTATNGAVTLVGTLGATSGGTSQSTYATGDLLYASATNTLSKLAAGTNGYILTLAGGVPTWAASTGGVTSFSAGTTGFTPSTGTMGAVTLAGTLNVANGGTGVTTSTGTGSVVLGTRPTLAVTGAGLTLQDATDNTKQANFSLAGLTTGTTYSYNLPAVSGAALATLGNITQAFSGAVSFSNNFDIPGNGFVTIGSSTGTATLTFGQSTVSQTTNIQAGATASGSTKTINIGTGGLTGSTTNINIGTATGASTSAITFGGTTNFSNLVTFANASTNITATNLATGSFTVGGALQTGTNTFGQSTLTNITNIASGATASGQTNTINIGNGGLTGSTTNIAIGSAAGTTTTTINGNASVAGQFSCGFGAFAMQGGSGYFGQTTGLCTYGFGTGATVSGSTKTLSFGTGGLAGSTTSISIGSTFGTTINLNGILQLAGAPGTSGQVLTSSATGTPTWTTPAGSNITAQGLYENASVIAANYTIGTGNNAVSAGPITINSGVTVTVPSGSVWAII